MQIILITGPRGCGKTALAHRLGQVIPYTVLFDNSGPDPLTVDRIRKVIFTDGSHKNCGCVIFTCSEDLVLTPDIERRVIVISMGALSSHENGPSFEQWMRVMNWRPRTDGVPVREKVLERFEAMETELKYLKTLL